MNKLMILFSCLITIGVQGQEWQTNLEETISKAKEKDQLILMVFQGSDWCIPCMKLEREILSTSSFKDLVQDQFIFLKIDFPRKKKHQLTREQSAHNARMAERYNPEGYFPRVVLLNTEGRVLGSMGYDKLTPKEYYEELIKLI